MYFLKYDHIANQLNGVTVSMGAIAPEVGQNVLTFTAEIAVIVLYGATSINGIYGLRSGVASDIIPSSTVSVSASGTTYTVTNNTSGIGARYILFKKV